MRKLKLNTELQKLALRLKNLLTILTRTALMFRVKGGFFGLTIIRTACRDGSHGSGIFGRN